MKTRITIAGLAAVGALLAGGGAALADDGSGQEARGDRCLRRAEAIAKRQGTSVAQLEARIRERGLARVEAALKAGRITEERAAQLRARIAAWRLCDGSAVRLHRAAHVHARVVRSMLAGAADYLGLTHVGLRAELRAGKSLQQIAEAKGKSVTALRAAMLAPTTAKLDQAVKDGRLTDARRDALVARYGALADRLIAKTFTARP